jgi:hypothetical protein
VFYFTQNEGHIGLGLVNVKKNNAIAPNEAWERRIQAREDETFRKNLVGESPIRSKL